MTPSERETWLRGVVSRISGKSADNVPIDADLGVAVGLDSLGKLEVLAEIEDEFGFLFSDNDLMAATTLARISRAIDEQLKEASEVTR